MGSRRIEAAGLAAAVVVSVMPAILVPMPPMLDYPNHYVRMWLIAGGVRLPPLSAIYAIDWSGASTNILIDLVALVLGGMLPIAVIGPLMLSLAIVLPPLGVAMLGWRVFGALQWWHVLCFVLAWNVVLLAGFLNFEISLGLALLGAAMDAWWARRGWLAAALLRSLFSFFLLIAHPFGVLFYSALLAGLAIGPRFTRGVWRCLLSAVIAGLPAVVPVAMLVLFAPALPGGDMAANAVSIVWQDRSLQAQAAMLLTGMRTYRLSDDLVFAAAVAVPLILAVGLRRLRMHAGLLSAAAVLTAGALLAPREVLGTSWIDRRLPCMVVLTLGAAVLPVFRPRTAWAMLLALLVVVGRVGLIGYVWMDRQADIASLRRSLAHVPPGAAVLPLEHLPASADIATAPVGRFLDRSANFWSEPVLAIMERRAFVPTLFTAVGKQPVRVLPPWNALAVREGGLAPVDQLGAAAAGAYVEQWRRFDFILVVNADMKNAGGELPHVPSISLVADEGFAQLYRIAR